MIRNIQKIVSDIRPAGDASIANFSTLIDFITKPAILINPNNNKILHTNDPANDLLAVKRKSIEATNTKDILPVSDFTKDPINQFIFDIEINEKQVISILSTYYHLTPKNDLGIIILDPVEKTPDPDEIKQDIEFTSLELIMDLINTSQQEPSPEIITRILKKGNQLLNGLSISVYLASSDSPLFNLSYSLGFSQWLPDRLGPQDVYKLTTPFNWISGNRIRSSIHSIAFKNSIEQVTTAPIGNDKALIGLLISASENRTRNSVYIVQIIASLISSLIQKLTTEEDQLTKYRSYQNAIELYENIYQFLHEGVILLDQDLKIIKINQSAEGLFGYSAQEALGKLVSKVMISSDNLTHILMQLTEEKRKREFTNYRLYRRSGEYFPSKLNIYPLDNETGPFHILILVSDLSDQEQIKEHNQELEQRAFLGEVSSIFAHEVRNPINNISTGLELMALNLSEDAENSEIITRLQNDCERLEGLMKSILNYSKPGEYTMVKVDLEQLLRRMLLQFSSRFSQYKIDTQFQVDNDITPIIGNYRALEQVFTNLIENSIQAMKESGGKLSIKINHIVEGETRNYIIIGIADTGPGIPDSDIDQIFKPFYSTKRGGTGLGLAISKRIITAHKGNIFVESIPGGTIFSIELPAHKD